MPKAREKAKTPTTRARSRKTNVKRGEPASAGPLSDVVGTILLGAALLHFLSLISYNPWDLPAWIPFSPTGQPNVPTQNFIGPLGAVISGLSIFFLGAASFLIPTGLIWFGICKLLSNHPLNLRGWTGFILVILTGACFLQLQHFALEDWRPAAPTEASRPAATTMGPGGGFGYFLGERLLKGIVGTAGAAILLLVAGSIGLAMMTGLHPVQFIRLLREGFGKLLARWRSGELFRMPSLEAEPVEAEAITKPKKPRATKKAAPAEPELEPETALEDLPLPKIIDTSAPRVVTDSKEEARKPTLEELKENLRKRKEERIASGATPSTQPSGTTRDLAQVYKEFQLPPKNLMSYREVEADATDESELVENQRKIIRTLQTFNIKVTPGDITRGPTITRYEVYPAEGLQVKKIATFEADIARATKAETINILAPIPGKDTVGIEIANSKKVVVGLRELLEDPAFQKTKMKIPLALGKDVYGNTIVGDLAAMPHLIIAGATGAGKSVCINCIIASLLYSFKPDELRFVMIDPKKVELQPYENIPHLAIPLVTDDKKALLGLKWVVKEMEHRYNVFQKAGVRDFTSFNKRKITKKKAAPKSEDPVAALPMFGNPAKGSSPEEQETVTHAVNIDHAGGEKDYVMDLPGMDDDEDFDIPEKFPYMVVIIDELADLMDTAKADVELSVVRLAQLARAAGIHLILATQTPRSEVITSRIRANVPCKIAFRVSSQVDSRVILETKGAERLVGKGDMLYLPPGTSTLVRAQGALIEDDEVEALVDYITEQAEPVFEPVLGSASEEYGEDETDFLDDDEDVSADDEALLERCIEVLRQGENASTSTLQRRLKIGYNRAARMMDILEMRGYVGPVDGAKPREILVDLGGGHI